MRLFMYSCKRLLFIFCFLIVPWARADFVEIIQDTQFEVKVSRTVADVYNEVLGVERSSRISEISQSSVNTPYVPKGPVKYFCGPTMSDGANVYIIWYGNWTTSGQQIIRNFFNSFGIENTAIDGSVRGWWNINSVFYNASGSFNSLNISLGIELSDNYSIGRNLTWNAISSLIIKATIARTLPLDTNGIYLFLSASDTGGSGLCTDSCGGHSYFILGGKYYKFAWIPNPQFCPSCRVGKPANGDLGVDGMITTIAHEVMEVVTDPQVTAWKTVQGAEVADMCAWQFGTTYDGNSYNLVGTNGSKFMVQMIYSPVVGKCVRGYNTIPPSSPPLAAFPAPSQNFPFMVPPPLLPLSPPTQPAPFPPAPALPLCAPPPPKLSHPPPPLLNPPQYLNPPPFLNPPPLSLVPSNSQPWSPPPSLILLPPPVAPSASPPTTPLHEPPSKPPQAPHPNPLIAKTPPPRASPKKSPPKPIIRPPPLKASPKKNPLKPLARPPPLKASPKKSPPKSFKRLPPLKGSPKKSPPMSYKRPPPPKAHDKFPPLPKHPLPRKSQLSRRSSRE